MKFGIRTNIKKIKENKAKYQHDILYHCPKKYAHKKIYKAYLNQDLDYKNVNDFNEKLQYLMVYKYGKKEGNLSDKIKVKDYVKDLNIKGLHIPKTLKIYDSVSDIKIDELPNKFVLKCNHASGGIIVCTDKKTFNLEENIPILEKTFNTNFAKKFFEYHYKYIKPQLFAEEYLDDKVNKFPLDYKFFCSNGKVQSIRVTSERDKKYKLTEFDKDWNVIDCMNDSVKTKNIVKKPTNLKELIRIAEELSKGIPFVRVDLYDINNKIYFGEYTFTPGAGLNTCYNEEGLKLHGDYINLNLYK